MRRVPEFIDTLGGRGDIRHSVGSDVARLFGTLGNVADRRSHFLDRRRDVMDVPRGLLGGL